MAHALLGPSSSSRWLSCPPSARLEAKEKDTASVYAKEGTLAHEICELIVRYNNHEFSKATFTRRLNKLKKHELYTADMIDHCEVYGGLIFEKHTAAKKVNSDAVLMVEQKLDFSEYVPEGFGTGDAVIVADNVLEVIDFKYGKGVEVSAVDNSQMKLYALGALLEYEVMYDIHEIRMTIVQPRLDNISEFTISVDELMEWAEKYVKPRAKMAFDGEGEFCAGKHCGFCKIKPQCRAYADKQLELAKYDFKDGDFLTLDEIADILTRATEFTKWLKAVGDYSLDQALNNGVVYPGYKLVEGRSNRKYSDQDKVAEILTSNGYDEVVIHKPKELLGITAMEKAIGKKVFGTLLGEVVIKPQGKPTLAPENDKRPAWHSEDDAKKDFESADSLL